MNGAATQFRVQIYAPDPAKHCVLYDETHTVDMSDSKGLFSINLGDVNPSRIHRDAPTTFSLAEAVSNRKDLEVPGSFCVPVVAGQAVYHPNPDDNRRVVIQFNDPGSMGGSWEQIPEMDINPVAYAMDSRSVGGFPASSIVRVVNTLGNPQSVSSLTASEMTELVRLAAGSSTKYLANDGAAGIQIPTGQPTSPAAGSIWFEGNNLKYSDGVNPPYTLGTAAAGSITGVSAGLGLSGGGTSGTVSLALAASGVGAGATKGSATLVPKITYDTYGRITGVVEETITGTVPNAGADGQVLKASGGSWASAPARTADLKSSSDEGSIFPAVVCTAAQTMYWNSGSDKFVCQNIALGAPSATVANSYKLVTVAADGRVNGGSSPTNLSGFGITDALSNQNGIASVESGADSAKGLTPTDGRLYIATDTKKIYRSGGGAWVEIVSASGSGGTITDVKVDANLSRSVSGTEITVGLPNKGTAGNYYKVTTDAQGRVIAGNPSLVAADIPSLDWTKITGTPTTLSGYGIAKNYVENYGSTVSLSAGNTAGRPGTPYVAGRIYIDTQANSVSYDTGAAWQTITSGSGFTGSLGGEVSGAQGSTQIGSINGINRTTITNNLNTVSAATDAATNSALVKRDGTGGFSAKEVRLVDGTTNAVKLKAAGTSADYSLQFPAAAPAPGQSLQSDGSGVLSWVTAAAGSLTNILQGTGINVTGSGATRTVTLADTTVTPNTYGSATQVPQFTVDQQGRITGATPVTITGTAPGGAASGDLANNYPNPKVVGLQTTPISSTAPGLGQVLKYVSSNWAASTLDLNDLKQNDNATSAMASASSVDCTASKTMYYDTSTKSLRCQNASIAAATQITGLLPVANGGTGVNASSITQNFVFAAPSSGAGAPTFRALTSADMPAIASYWQSATGGINYAGGNVGIGATAPASLLQIGNGSDGRANGLQFQKDYRYYIHPQSSLNALVLDANGDVDKNNGGSNLGGGNIIFKTAQGTANGGAGASVEQMRIDWTGKVGIGTTSPAASLDLSARTDALALPKGTTAQQPAGPSDGWLRYNTTKAALEVFTGATWATVGGAAPAGMISAYPTATCPTGWLEASGAAVSRATYASLFTAIGTTYGAGDGSTTFNLPDYRGYFLRGWDHGAGNDPDTSGRTTRGDGTTGDNVGTKQTGQIQSHTHSSAGYTSMGSGGYGAYTASSVGSPYAMGATGGNETRPKNINVTYCVNTATTSASTTASSGSGTAGYLPQWTSSTALGNSPVAVSGGNVGVGTTTPAAKLDVAGEVKFGNTASACNTTNEGQQRYNSTAKIMEFCNGTAWLTFGSSSYLDSGELTVPTNSITSWSHGQSSAPKYFGAYLICKTAEHGYAIGDRIDVSSGWHQSGTSVSHTAGSNATSLWFSQNSGYGVATIKKDGTGYADLNRANWKVILWGVW